MYFDDACDATTAAVVEICRHLSDIAKVPSGKLPDVVVVNRYAEAASCIAWHADDQPDFDAVEKTAYIIGLSFGSPGKFLWRRKERQHEVEGGVVLERGSGILMAGHFQGRMEHCTQAASDGDWASPDIVQAYSTNPRFSRGRDDGGTRNLHSSDQTRLKLI